MKIEIDQSGMDKLFKQVNGKIKKAEVEANEAAAAKDTPAEKARAFVDVMRKYGVDLDVDTVRRQFGG